MTDPAPPPRGTPPIVVDADDGLNLFSSIDAAIGYIEVPDVETGVYGRAFDAVGHPVRIEVPDPLFLQAPRRRGLVSRLFFRLMPPGFNDVVVAVDADVPPDPEGLVALLQERLGDERTDLEALLATAHERCGVRS